ncbi:hypothetical protein QWY75_04615 [Pontixanthobacter aestiaquae]|uniref:Uncharacterized protein n=1 Tax=Pontixanthobacter aestiaquae TaxID=1509367 RepID=A0A844Z4A2_9SPHN|nr:hypothetical protein [Pontixanthobacter aestiaquae]MDN3645491.1 hypothetical protein [Pontixanthobacter aestiaquae]MXO83511.1 hypothetical protein [Pontixanthobacter aestiaquae]
MSRRLERQLREDRNLRDAALALVKADLSHLKTDIGMKGVGARLATRMSEGATDVFEEAVEVADSNKGALLALVAAVFLWFARNPIMELFSDEEANGEDTLPQAVEPTDEI